VLALTSNPEAPQFQHARTEMGGTVAGTVLDELRKLNADAETMGSFGAVVGATISDTSEDLDVNGPLLVPGIGAQGGEIEPVLRDGPATATPAAGGTGRGLLVNVSRGISDAALGEPRPGQPTDAGERLAAAAVDWASRLPVLT